MDLELMTKNMIFIVQAVMDISKVETSRSLRKNVIIIKNVNNPDNRILIRSLSKKTLKIDITAYNRGDYLTMDIHIPALYYLLKESKILDKDLLKKLHTIFRLNH